MGRKRQRRVLDVYIGTSKVGQYVRAPNDAISFRYAPDWLSSDRAFPISLSMPLSDRIWSGQSASSYFDGLLPDDQAIREKIAAREHAESAGVFDLLAVIGRDCVGALRFVPEDADPGDPNRMAYRPLDDQEIDSRLSNLGASPLGLHTDEDDFRISLAGVQEKTAFLWIDGQWQLPLGTTPTSHIFKPAMKAAPDGADFSDTPWNEWLCLTLCRALGLETANAEIHKFDGKPVIVVERFDRGWRDGVLYRLPQEDLCQALGVPPLRKYQSDGGPDILDIMALLESAIAPYEDRLTFMRAQVVFWLLAAIDGHAKNFSIFLTPGGFRLTPLYDVMSAAPYPQYPPQKMKLAMAIGDNKYYRLRQIQIRHFYQTGKKAGLGEADMEGLLTGLTSRVEGAIAEVSELASVSGIPESTFMPILDGLRQRAGMIGPARVS